jgi:hypothetical protein
MRSCFTSGEQVRIPSSKTGSSKGSVRYGAYNGVPFPDCGVAYLTRPEKCGVAPLKRQPDPTYVAHPGWLWPTSRVFCLGTR